ncbi:MAG: LCP family protein [Vulcanimicrobiota bacterium]
MAKIDKLTFKKNPPSGIKRMLVFCFVLFFCAFIVLVGGFAYIYYITPPDAHNTIADSLRFVVNPGQTAFQGKDRMIILCLGVDNNWTDKNLVYTKGARTDTIMLASIDSKAEALNILSVPRDTWVKISDEQGFDKINAAYAYGGLDTAKRVIERFLGVQVDHYVLLKVQTTTNLINAIGGVEIDVMKDMDYDDNWGHLHIHLKKGHQLLNGEQAVGYARFRHDEEGDWGRIRRQQQVINALIRELKKPSNVMRINTLARIVKEGIETDMSLAQLIDLGRLYKDFDRPKMKTGIVKGDDGGDAGLSYIIPYEDEKNTLVRRLLLRDTSLPPADLKIGVLNGSDIEGQAIEVADTLEKSGYKITRVADADRSDYTYTKIIDHIHDPRLANSMEQFVGPLEYVGDDEEKKENDEDITIIVGKNFRQWKDTRKQNQAETQKNTGYEENPVRPPQYYTQPSYGTDDQASAPKTIEAPPARTDNPEAVQTTAGGAPQKPEPTEPTDIDAIKIPHIDEEPETSAPPTPIIPATRSEQEQEDNPPATVKVPKKSDINKEYQ